jgi:hypothetical protein
MSKEPTTVDRGLTHGAVTIGTSATQLVASGRKLARGVTFKTPVGNAGVVYIGSAANVSATTGYPLAAAETLFVPVESLDQVWIVASAVDQSLRFIGI